MTPMSGHSEALGTTAAASWRMTAKRLEDIVIAAIGIVVLAPVFVAVAITIRLEDGGPVFYRQVRIGRAGKPFEIDKFRSMTPAPKGVGSSLTIAGDPRVTRVGAFLRRAKLDELPQLFNVLQGEMSLVGPRPEAPDLMLHYTRSQRAVMVSVRPGMTDYASVLLRDESELLARAPDPARFYRERIMPLKCELCAHYLGDLGPLTDMRIVLATIWSIIFPRAPNPMIDRAIASRLERAFAQGNDDVA
jgi:lipopolysaccharide/colanic/teichoic acid biosynthesis glycosyltransferase